MRNKNIAKEEEKEEEEEEQKKRQAILKAAAQAWLSHSESSRPAALEFEAQRRCNYVKGKPSRFKLEASSMADCHLSSSTWDFRQSLWDSYEIVTVSKKLERELSLENSFSGIVGGYDFSRLLVVKKRESRNNLKSLFNLVRSRRFKESDVPLDE